jgi:hypothetical protein
MNCKHERLRTVGDRLFCCVCNAELPLEFLTGAPAKAENSANDAPAEVKTGKSAAKKRTAKKTD